MRKSQTLVSHVHRHESCAAFLCLSGGSEFRVCVKLVSGVFVSPQVSVLGSICVWRRIKQRRTGDRTKPAIRSATPESPNPPPHGPTPTPPKPPAGQRSQTRVLQKKKLFLPLFVLVVLYFTSFVVFICIYCVKQMYIKCCCKNVQNRRLT